MEATLLLLTWSIYQPHTLFFPPSFFSSFLFSIVFLAPFSRHLSCLNREKYPHNIMLPSPCFTILRVVSSVWFLTTIAHCAKVKSFILISLVQETLYVCWVSNMAFGKLHTAWKLLGTGVFILSSWHFCTIAHRFRLFMVVNGHTRANLGVSQQWG